MSAYKSCPEWVTHIEYLFDKSDLDNDGIVTLEDFELLTDNFVRESKADKELLDRVQVTNMDFWKGVGLKPGMECAKDQFIDKMVEFCVAEKAKIDHGYRSFIEDSSDALFNIADTNKDGSLDFEEFQILTRPSNHTEEEARAIFNMIDENQDGQLSRQEIKDMEFAVWFVTGQD